MSAIFLFLSLLGSLFAATGEVKERLVADLKKLACHESGYEMIEGKPFYVASDENCNGFIVFGNYIGKTYRGAIMSIEVQRGKPLYMVALDSTTFGFNDHLVVWGDWESKLYDFIHGVQVTPEGKLMFVGREGEFNDPNGVDILVFDGREMARFPQICDLSSFRGQPLYVAQENDKRFVMLGKKAISKRYDGVSELEVTADNTIAYMANDAGRTMYVRIRNGRTQTFDLGSVSVTSVALVNGQLLYHELVKSALDFGAARELVVYGEERGSFFDDVIGPIQILNGKPLYTAHDKDDRGAVNHTYVVHGNRVWTYDQVGDELVIADGAPLYVAIKGGRLLIVHGEQMLVDTDRYVWASQPQIVDGVLQYVAMLPDPEKGKIGQWWTGDREVFVRSDIEYPASTGFIHDVPLVRGEPLYVAYDADSQRVSVVHGMLAVWSSDTYEWLDGLRAEGKNAKFYAFKERQVYEVTVPLY